MDFNEYSDKYNLIKHYLISFSSDIDTHAESLKDDRTRITSTTNIEIDNRPIALEYVGIFRKVDGEKIPESECISIDNVGFLLSNHYAEKVSKDNRFQSIYDTINSRKIQKDLFEF